MGRVVRKCMRDDCNRPHRAKGYCDYHYKRHRRGADMDAPHKADTLFKVCIVEGCEDRRSVRGMCPLHAYRDRVGKPLDDPYRYDVNKGVCIVPECEKPRHCKKMCILHYGRSRTGKIPLNSPRLTALCSIGDERVNGSGYVDIKVRNDRNARHKNWVRKHRHVMEQHIGRPLRKEETVHHMNGDRQDNRLENLELWDSDHPSGQRTADKFKWAVEYVKRYESEFRDEKRSAQ